MCLSGGSVYIYFPVNIWKQLERHSLECKPSTVVEQFQQWTHWLPLCESLQSSPLQSSLSLDGLPFRILSSVKQYRRTWDCKVCSREDSIKFGRNSPMTFEFSWIRINAHANSNKNIPVPLSKVTRQIYSKTNRPTAWLKQATVTLTLQHKLYVSTTKNAARIFYETKLPPPRSMFFSVC